MTATMVDMRLWAGFAAMCIGMFMAILDIQIVATSLPAIQAALAIDQDRMSWVQTAYLIAEVIAIPLTGYLTRALTMRGLFAVAIAIFTLASAGCASSGSFGWLISWRLLQGLAGGVLIPLVFSAVFLLFPERLQGMATTIAGVLAVLAPTLGPSIGGWITETWSWPWLFLVNLAPGVVACIGAMAFLPRDRPQVGLLRDLDWPALALLALCLATLEITLKEAPRLGWSTPPVAALATITLLAGWAFGSRCLCRSMPLVDLRTLADRRFAVACALSFALGIGLYGSVYLMPVFLGFVRNQQPLAIGLVMLVTGTTQLLVAPLAVQLERRVSARLLTAMGFLVFGIGLGMSAFATRTTGYDEMFWPQVVRGAAIMFCLLPPTRLALGHLAPDRVGDASGLFNLMRNLGGAVGIALIDTVIWHLSLIHI